MGCNCNDGCSGSFTLPSGSAGADGVNGSNGVDGVGVSNTYVDSNGNLQVQLTSGTIINAGLVKGADGTDGTCDCSTSVSKYEINAFAVTFASTSSFEYSTSVANSAITGSTCGELIVPCAISGSTLSSIGAFAHTAWAKHTSTDSWFPIRALSLSDVPSGSGTEYHLQVSDSSGQISWTVYTNGQALKLDLRLIIVG